MYHKYTKIKIQYNENNTTRYTKQQNTIKIEEYELRPIMRLALQ